MFFTKKGQNKYTKDVLGFAGIGITAGVTSQVLGEVGAPEAQQAIGKVTKHLPTLGGLYGASMAIDAVDEFGRKTNKKLRRY